MSEKPGRDGIEMYSWNVKIFLAKRKFIADKSYLNLNATVSAVALCISCGFAAFLSFFARSPYQRAKSETNWIMRLTFFLNLLLLFQD